MKSPNAKVYASLAEPQASRIPSASARSRFFKSSHWIDSTAPICDQGPVSRPDHRQKKSSALSPNCIWLCLALLLNGCMTHALWTGELVETFHEPSFPNHLALFEASEKQDVIVQYDE